MRSKVWGAPTPASSHLKTEPKSVTMSVCVCVCVYVCACVIRLRYILRRISYSWCEDTSHHAGGTRNTSYTSHHSSAVTKQHDRIKGRGKRGAGERTCVGRGEGCAKIKGCRRSESNVRDCAHTITPPTPPTPQISESSPLPFWLTEDPTCAAETTCWEKFSSCWRDSAVLHTGKSTTNDTKMACYYYLILSEAVLTSPFTLPEREQAVRVCLHVAPRSGGPAGWYSCHSSFTGNDSWKQMTIRCGVI